MFVCMRASLYSVRFRQLLRCAHKHIVNNIIIKVHIERNNMQVELIRFRKSIAFIHVYFCEAKNSTRPACLHWESHYNISMFDSNHFNYIDMSPLFCVQSSYRKSSHHVHVR